MTDIFQFAPIGTALATELSKHIMNGAVLPGFDKPLNPLVGLGIKYVAEIVENEFQTRKIGTRDLEGAATVGASSEMQRENARLEEQLKEARKIVSDLIKKINSAEHNQNDTLKQLLAQEQKCKQLENQLGEIKSTQSKTQVGDKTFGFASLPATHTRDPISERHINYLMNMLESKQEAYKRKENQSKSKIAQLKKEIDDLKKSFQKENGESRCKIAELKEKIQRLEQELEKNSGEISELKAKIDLLKDESPLLCKICASEQIDSRLHPCGHTICASCVLRIANNGSNCPFCRNKFEQSQNVHFQ